MHRGPSAARVWKRGISRVCSRWGLVSSASTTATAAALTTNGSISPEIGGAAAVVASVASTLITIPVVHRLNHRLNLGGFVAAAALATVIGLTVLALTDHDLINIFR
jgi:uncharacterized membrane protein (DUF4010 family)